MTPFILSLEDCGFPDTLNAPKDLPLAMGGDLSRERLLAAYAKGIFPWYSQGEPILWWSPDPRFVLYPSEIHISRSMENILKRDIFQVTMDRDFPAVISSCQTSKRKTQGTWLMDEMIRAYNDLWQEGYAHSVEVWQGSELVGGLYGVSLGRVFFGESMFSRRSNASKYGLIYLTARLAKANFDLIDCQVYTAHLESLGARMIRRRRFLEILEKSLGFETLQGNWGKIFT
jgi:leucyl/phenylalanyl-tRNA--protein transferase